jgi:hypothetical protein
MRERFDAKSSLRLNLALQAKTPTGRRGFFLFPASIIADSMEG